MSHHLCTFQYTFPPWNPGPAETEFIGPPRTPPAPNTTRVTPPVTTPVPSIATDYNIIGTSRGKDRHDNKIIGLYIISIYILALKQYTKPGDLINLLLYFVISVSMKHIAIHLSVGFFYDDNLFLIKKDIVMGLP